MPNVLPPRALPVASVKTPAMGTPWSAGEFTDGALLEFSVTLLNTSPFTCE